MLNVKVNGTSLGYVEKGTGQPVLFVHGGSGDFRVWDNQIEAFAAKYRAIALSCRHYYPNAPIREGGTLSLETHVEDLAAFVRTLGLAPVHLVGHSSPGAFGGLLLAQKEPELLRTLVLAEPPALSLLGLSLPPQPRQMLRLLLRDPRVAIAVMKFGARGIAPAGRAFARGDDQEGLQIFVKANLGEEGFARLPAAMRQHMQENIEPLKAQFRAGFPPFDVCDARSIRTPTLLVTGEHSILVLRRIADRLEHLMPSVQRVEIQCASHGMIWEKPDVFNQAVLAFLDRHSD